MQRRIVRTSLLMPMIAVMLLVTGSAFAQVPNPDTVYQIIARHSGKCIEVDGGPGAFSNGALVVQRRCNGAATNQLWTFNSVGAGYYTITARHSGKVLDVFGGVFSGADGVIVEQWDFNGSPNQMWNLGDVGDGYFSITARHSNKSLDIKGVAPYDGAQVQQNTYGSGANQQFRLVPVSRR